MTWKEELRLLEQNKLWDSAIELLQYTIKNAPEEMDAYLNINYLLIFLLVEENYNDNLQDYYISLIKHYFKESYERFNNIPDYLFYTGITVLISEWYFDIETKESENMIIQAKKIDKDNILYRWGYYAYVKNTTDENKKLCHLIANEIVANKIIIEQIISKGSLGHYIKEMINFSISNNQK